MINKDPLKVSRISTLQAVVELYEEGKLLEDFARLPRLLLPGDHTFYGESVYLEREILKQRIKIFLNFDIEKTANMELYELKEFLEARLDGKQYPKEYRGIDKAIEVIREACDQCPESKYYATDLCRNCTAKSCFNACPKDAITFKNNRAVIDNRKCINCGLCAKACRYSAVVKLQRPCETSCGVNAIKADERGRAKIDRDRCVSCGSCHIACPFGAIESPTHLIDVISKIKTGEKVIALYAPSIMTQFGTNVSVGQLHSLFKELGFSDSIAVAEGADEVATEEAADMETRNKKMTTSCCPAFYEYIQKHKPEAKEYLSHVASPMMIMANRIKEEDPNCKLVFIGPCTAKKIEARKYKKVSNVLTFVDVVAWCDAKEINFSKLEEQEVSGSFDGWNFARSGGVAQAVANKCSKEVQVIYMNGIKEARQAFAQFKVAGPDTLLEGMGCQGGCLAGPSIVQKPAVTSAMLKKIKK
ncbi:MAG: monomeric [FeFe] hydrogenase [Psychrilyobacter sp.]|nr:monomeric [FeFe] hydrogenase [Psychrilyobacter sp.]